MQHTIMHDIKLLLPSLIKSAVQFEVASVLKKNEELSLEVAKLTKTNQDLTNKLNGYKKQTEKWISITKEMEDETLPGLCEQVKALETAWKNKEKSLANKTKDFIATQNKLKSEMSEATNLKAEWEDLLKAKTDGTKIINIEKSQEFVSAEYDDFREIQKNILNDVTNLKVTVAQKSAKTEHNANYTRFDCFEVGGVPPVLDVHGNEDCKGIILGLCRELQYWLPPSSISTAHRLKKHPNKRGPPAIIFKFNSQDIRNDVFDLLRNYIKAKYQWQCFNIRKLYVNFFI